MADIESVKQAISQVVVETAKAATLTVSVIGRMESITPKKNNAPEATKHRTSPRTTSHQLESKRQVCRT